MSKPSWDSAPEWATHLEQDIDKSWWWYEYKPTLASTGFWEVDGGITARITTWPELLAAWQRTYRDLELDVWESNDKTKKMIRHGGWEDKSHETVKKEQP